MIPMIVNSTSTRRSLCLSAVVVLALTSFLVTGCKSNPPTSATSTAPKRVPVTPPPAVKKHLYPADADPMNDITVALEQARHEHKRVILDFGGDWCGDCQVLDIYFHQSPNLELVENNFLIVHVDIGHMDKNLDVAEKYGIPLKKGVPALAVLDAKGNTLYSQDTGEFEDMRYMQSTSVTDFLNRWKA
jgi:thiol:disulfide interchange protein